MHFRAFAYGAALYCIVLWNTISEQENLQPKDWSRKAVSIAVGYRSYAQSEGRWA
jgi:hypothetical protein